MMQAKESEKELGLKFKMYIDYDRFNQGFYHNFYFDDYKFVLKIPLTPQINDGENDFDDNVNDARDSNNGFDVRLEKFDLTKYVYLLYFEK